MNREALIQEIEEKGSFSFARSGGPGGQNVNKVNTKVLLTLFPEQLSLNDNQVGLVRQKLKGRVNSRGELFIQMQQERSQLMNRQLAAEMLADLIIKSLHKPRTRKKTKPSKASVQRRLDAKKRHSAKKKSRGIFSGME